MGKFKFLAILAALTMCMSFNASAQTADAVPYIDPDSVPDITTWLPGPPDSTSTHYAYDMHRYQWWKTLRADAQRADEAIKDSVEETNDFLARFTEAFGMELSEEKTPEIYTLINRALKTSNVVLDPAKAHWFRTRPFVVFNQHTLTPDSEPRLSKNGSYPSGHTNHGWVAAMLLTEINPARANEIFQRGYEMGNSRLIVGMHWQSDVDDARLVSAMACALMHSDKEFLEQMEKAKAEYQQISTNISSAKTSVNITDGKAYTTSGIPATSESKGIIIQNGTKVLKR